MSDPLFTYNQFKNPNDEGIYYSNHFHNINNGTNVPMHGHNHYGATCPDSGYPGYSTHRQNIFPHLNRKWLIRENISQNNQPVFRTHLNASNAIASGSAITSSSTKMQPSIRGEDDKFKFSSLRMPTSSGEETERKHGRNILEQMTVGGQNNITIFRNYEEMYRMTRSQSEMQVLGGSSGSSVNTVGVDLSSVELTSLANGVYSYLDYNQSSTILTDEQGGKHMTILPLKEPGPPAEYKFIMGIRGGVGGSSYDSTLKNQLNKRPSIMFHGIPTHKDANQEEIRGKNIKETIMEDISGNHTHYFPVRGHVLNGYTVNHSTFNHHDESYDDKNHQIPKFPNPHAFKHISGKPPTLMNLNIHSGQSHGHFGLF